MFLKWPFIGVIVETFGFLNLFGCVIGAILVLSFLILFMKRLLPRYFDVPSTTTLRWQLIDFAIYPGCKATSKHDCP